MTQITMLVMAVLLVTSMDSFWGLWVSLELYSFFLLPWLLESESKISKVYVFYYFLMQFLASIVFLAAAVTFFNKVCSIAMFFSLLMKMSCFPFHSWFVNILPYMSWEKVMVLVSLSKLIPLPMLGVLMPPQGFMLILMLGLLLPLGGFSTVCLRSIMAYSSIAHSSWLVICMCMSSTISMFYIISYLIVSIPLCFFFMLESMFSMKTTLISKKSSIQLLMLILALSGLPPFIGFIPKLLVIQTLTLSGALVEACILGVMSVLPMYFYFKVGTLVLESSSFSEFSFFKSSGLVVMIVSGVCLTALIFLMLGFSLSKENISLSS